MMRRAYLYFGLTFLFGIVAGAVGFYFYAFQTGLLHRSFSRQRLVQHLTRDLDLSPDQVQRVNSILDDEGKKYHQMQDQVRTEADALHKETRGHIREILRPEQATKFDALVRQHEQERMRHRRAP